ncbi:hypothetical protein XENTR_v10010276 [Xenopus tropicalis]|nr:hypothetical protein XENTR_v10010276 [Xenopus tropicalis]
MLLCKVLVECFPSNKTGNADAAPLYVFPVGFISCISSLAPLCPLLVSFLLSPYPCFVFSCPTLEALLHLPCTHFP